MEQFTALVRHFFGRFFDNEFVAQNTEMHVTVSKILALLAAPGVILPCMRLTTYLQLDAYPPELRLPTLWFDRSFFICFSMLVMGGVTVLEWDALFPDRRDYLSLMPLPIHARTMFLAKVGALLVFLLGFTISVNFVSTFLFPLVSYRPIGRESNTMQYHHRDDRIRLPRRRLRSLLPTRSCSFRWSRSKAYY